MRALNLMKRLPSSSLPPQLVVCEVESPEDDREGSQAAQAFGQTIRRESQEKMISRDLELCNCYSYCRLPRRMYALPGALKTLRLLIVFCTAVSARRAVVRIKVTHP